MFVEENTAETTKEIDDTVISEEVEGNADPDSSNNVDVEFGEKDVETETEIKPAQSKEENGEFARKRRESEKQAEIKKARESAIIETLKGKNPYTEEAIKDSADVEEYLLMREIEEGGGDPLTDYSKYLKQKTKKETEVDAKQGASGEWYQSDRNNFHTAYPKVDLAKLVEDEPFKLFSDGKTGKMPMTKIYADYLKMTGDYDKKAKQMAQRLVANANASPGSLKSNGTAESGLFTLEQIKAMSQQEVDKNYDKIRESLAKIKK